MGGGTEAARVLGCVGAQAPHAAAEGRATAVRGEARAAGPELGLGWR